MHACMRSSFACLAFAKRQLTGGTADVCAIPSLAAGIVYGLYLTLSSWVLFYVATHMTFFHDSCHLQVCAAPSSLMCRHFVILPLTLSNEGP